MHQFRHRHKDGSRTSCKGTVKAILLFLTGQHIYVSIWHYRSNGKSSWEKLEPLWSKTEKLKCQRKIACSNQIPMYRNEPWISKIEKQTTIQTLQCLEKQYNSNLTCFQFCYQGDGLSNLKSCIKSVIDKNWANLPGHNKPHQNQFL